MTEYKYPPYACDCCGVANGDMFWDYIESNAANLTFAEVQDLCDEFDTYRANWHKCNEEASNAVRGGKRRTRKLATPPIKGKDREYEQTKY